MASAQRRVVIAGGAGLVGRRLAERLAASGWHPVVLSRRPAVGGLPEGVEVQSWDRLREAFEGAAGVVNLAGEGIADRRWSPARKEVLRVSRLGPTRRLVEALGACSQRPPVLINASATGFYGDRPRPGLSEDAEPGTGFLPDLCLAWEAEARRAEALGVRVVLPRIGVVLAREGGALPTMARPVRGFAGALLGSGRQGLPWIHLDDLVALLSRALEDPGWSGPINATAPETLDHAAFMQALARRLKRPLWPVPAFLTRAALRLFVGEMAEALLLKGAFVHPARAQDLGFTFRFPTAAAALEDLL